MNQKDKERYIPLLALAEMWEERDRNEQHASVILTMDADVMEWGWEWWITHHRHHYEELITATGYIARAVDCAEKAQVVNDVADLITSAYRFRGDVIVTCIQPLRIEVTTHVIADLLERRTRRYRDLHSRFLDIAQEVLM